MDIQSFEASLREHLRRDARDPGFWLEIFALLGLLWYAYEAQQANVINRSNLGAVFEMQPDLQWPRGIVALKFPNVGKSTSRRVSGKVEIVRQRVGDDAVLDKTTADIGGRNEMAEPTAGPYKLIAIIPNKNMEAFLNVIRGQKITVKAALDYDDGVGDSLSQKWCKVFIAEYEGGGSTSLAWPECDNGTAIIKAESTEIRSLPLKLEGTVRTNPPPQPSATP